MSRVSQSRLWHIVDEVERNHVNGQFLTKCKLKFFKSIFAPQCYVHRTCWLFNHIIVLQVVNLACLCWLLVGTFCNLHLDGTCFVPRPDVFLLRTYSILNVLNDKKQHTRKQSSFVNVVLRQRLTSRWVSG